MITELELGLIALIFNTDSSNLFWDPQHNALRATIQKAYRKAPAWDLEQSMNVLYSQNVFVTMEHLGDSQTSIEPNDTYQSAYENISVCIPTDR